MGKPGSRLGSSLLMMVDALDRWADEHGAKLASLTSAAARQLGRPAVQGRSSWQRINSRLFLGMGALKMVLMRSLRRQADSPRARMAEDGRKKRRQESELQERGKKVRASGPLQLQVATPVRGLLEGVRPTNGRTHSKAFLTWARLDPQLASGVKWGGRCSRRTENPPGVRMV